MSVGKLDKKDFTFSSDFWGWGELGKGILHSGVIFEVGENCKREFYTQGDFWDSGELNTGI